MRFGPGVRLVDSSTKRVAAEDREAETTIQT
ncbi:hypothetical protein EG68_10325 [Paragonimus skrjabini miyazakii]|uniref:Uncharacterized protein n=1 Tax=Paragonimus skrjabini miyazakii TaxID=59628 RepID=A0A8S9Y8K0_9TREM|nr:hypothetical protein EG68_10325 [Paragonimus skrjabini miyazakii]